MWLTVSFTEILSIYYALNMQPSDLANQVEFWQALIMSDGHPNQTSLSQGQSNQTNKQTWD